MDVAPKSKVAAGRRTKPRRGSERDSERRSGEQRGDFLKRRLVQFFQHYQMPKAADVVKTTKLIEPLITVILTVLSGFSNHAVMGSAGISLVIALTFHELGHFQATRKVGYRPSWWWFIPLLGAVMRFPNIKERSDEAEIAYGGPLYGFYFTLLLVGIWWIIVFFDDSHTLKSLNNLVFITAFISVLLNLFNLIPISPLDGGRICQGMDGAWPKYMRLLGFVALIIVTAFSRQATMLIIWILVIGEVRMSLFGNELNKKWKYYLSVIIFMAMLLQLSHEFIHGKLLSWNLFGELMYTLLACYIIRGYYHEWKKPEFYHPNRELRLRPIKPQVGKVIRLRYFLLLSGLLLLGAILVYGLNFLK